MTLDKHLTTRNISNAEFGRRVGRTEEAVRRYRTGKRDPDAATKRAIFFATNGAVEPNDFYNVEAWRAGLED
ncbi:MAG: hypothetical protein K2Q10_07270 [Rhodospirillales bacterium]|nr:hypothetical protein [Rhodospirillales bacterium]